MEELYRFPARIIQPTTPAADLRALLPDDLGDIEPFFWPAEISSNRLDAYFTHMAESTLRNYANDAAEGRTFLDSHNSRNLGYGQSLTGVFQVEGDVSRVVSDFYTVRGLRFGSGVTYESTDDFIRAIQARLVRDVSVGFYGGDMICDICGGSFMDWREGCEHWPGMEYAIGDKGNETVIATFSIEDAHLAEVSAVYEGATPGAMLLRAQEMTDAGEMPPEMARRLELKYRIKLPGAARSWPGADTKRGKTAPERTNKVDELEQARALLAEINAAGETVIDQLRWLVDENARLAPLADQGQQYRRDLIDQALAEGVRAMGDAFPSETYRGILERAGVEQIKEIKDNFARQAAAVFTGGRATTDGHEPPKAAERPAAPRSLYRV